jgi:outer membrane protein assembly factor BamE
MLAVLLVAGCSIENIPGIYRIDIQQGNVVTQEMIDQLEPGMDRRKVRFILGTPLLRDTFNEDRWDYIYSYQRGGGKRVQRRVSVYFENERLAKIEGDVRPGAMRRPVVARQETVVSVPPGSSDSEGFFAALKSDFFNRKKKSIAAEKPPETPREPETQESETPSPPASEETSATDSVESTAILPTEPLPAAPSPQDQAYLEQLFEGFGKPGVRQPGPAATVAGARSESTGAADEETPIDYEDDDLGIEDTSLQNQTAAETDNAKPSLFTRLLNRLRQDDEKDAAESQRPETPSPASNEPAAP